MHSGTLRNVPLSKDPEKRARQLANLGRGGEVAAQRHALPTGAEVPHQATESGHPAAAPAAGGGPGLPVVGYGTAEAAAASPPEPAAAAPSVPARPEHHGLHQPEELEDELEDEVEDNEPTDRRGGGFLDGFFGR